MGGRKSQRIAVPHICGYGHLVGGSELYDVWLQKRGDDKGRRGNNTNAFLRSTALIVNQPTATPDKADSQIRAARIFPSATTAPSIQSARLVRSRAKSCGE